MRNIHLTFVILKNQKVCLLTTYTEINIQFNVVPVKSKVEISQNFLAFSEYINFTLHICSALVASEFEQPQNKGTTAIKSCATLRIEIHRTTKTIITDLDKFSNQ